MGIKHFFFWYKNQFENNITPLKEGQKFDKPIDTLLLDLNCIFHNSTQKVYEYGTGKKPPRLMSQRKPIVDNRETRKLVYQDICESIDKLVSITNPRKRIFLAIDGPAPIGKQNQQRQRRFRSASESGDNVVFDSNAITPGTVFMHELSLYIDGFLLQQKGSDSKWLDLEVIFSDEKVPGEGEHKAVEFIRESGEEDEIYCINGLDADLIMLSMATHKPNFYIIREDLYDPHIEYLCIDVGGAKNTLVEKIKWKSSVNEFDEKTSINDFIFMCFMVGNDFLPHIPSIEIIEDGLELMIDIYRSVGTVSGHLTQTDMNGLVSFCKDPLRMFLETIGKHEKVNFEKKLKKKKSFFPDPLLLKHSNNDSCGNWFLDLDRYTEDYNLQSFKVDGNRLDMEDVSHQYIQGLCWVITYYTTGCPSWKWYFPYQYAPTAKTLSKYVETFVSCNYGVTEPSEPFQQLLSVLPPKSAHLLPKPLDKLLTDKTSELVKFCPEKLVIDLAGKRKEWEGITLLPMVDQSLVERMLKSKIGDVVDTDILRNIPGMVIMYD